MGYNTDMEVKIIDNIEANWDILYVKALERLSRHEHKGLPALSTKKDIYRKMPILKILEKLA
jgi:hypothetical protein